MMKHMRDMNAEEIIKKIVDAGHWCTMCYGTGMLLTILVGQDMSIKGQRQLCRCIIDKMALDPQFKEVAW